MGKEPPLSPKAPSKDEGPPLYQAECGAIRKADIVSALRSLGLRNGDVALVHSDISVFGKLATKSRSLLLGSIVEGFQECLGVEGTLLMPTFSFAFCRTGFFDVAETPSEVGVLTEFFRRLPDVERTPHAIYSFAVWGSGADFWADVDTDAFSNNSVFGKLHRCNAKMVGFGSAFQSTFSLLHYIEQQHGVPYRFKKSFKGTVVDGPRTYEGKFSFYVRYKRKPAVLNTSRLESLLEKEGLLNQVQLGEGRILMVKAKDLYDVGYRELDRNIYYFLEGKPRRVSRGY